MSQDELERFFEEREANIDKYIKDNGIEFKIMAVNDSGEVLIQKTTSISFDDLVGYVDDLDEQFNKLALEEPENDEDWSGATEGDR